ncbi:hypothetical protein B0O80DRAFT_432152 [Mortierella sp. GBAus27b]|nr:hypothetical protein BGX31_004993 [Mortierella sp. GBA43]KAI8362900.1 hypothetical protein B0O80DRAFT_432152 [Mortierella sp. GBAus27b]
MENQTAADSSIKAFTSSLTFNAAVGAGVFVAFAIVRYWSKKVYQPRTYLVSDEKRSPELPTGLFSWVTASFSVPDSVLVERIGLDAYMFLRFMRMAAFLFAGFTLVGIPVLIPANVVPPNFVDSTGGTKVGLNKLNIGNVGEPWRLWFHLILTIVFCFSTLFMLWREMQEYTRRRHAYLMSEKHRKTPQATTILVTAIPDGLNNEDALYDIFNRFPGGVRSIWLNRDPSKLTDLTEERETVVMKLEAALYAYVQSAYGPRKKTDPELKEPVRPIGRTSMIPFVGPKVDLIEFYTNRLAELNQEIGQLQEHGATPALNSAFIRFHTQFGAHSAVQTVVHPSPYQMAPMHVEISPLDVVWSHMNMSTLVRKGRTFLSVSAATALALFWSIPVVFVSTIANLDKLIQTFGFLAFLKKLPPDVVGGIQGILPPLFMAILMALLPVILTIMATLEGHVRYSSIMISLQQKYFVFLVINVLLLSTISNGFLNLLGKMSGMTFLDIVNLMSGHLPDASTFFVTYALLQGFTGPVMELLQLTPLILNIVFTKMLGRSPRQIWNIQGRLSSVNYGVIFPQQILMFSVGMVYSTISPLILPLVTFFFTMFYLVYRHQFLYVYQQVHETGGLAFPVAIKQAYAGIFIFEITILGIFLLQGTANLPHVVLMLLAIGVTVVSLYGMNEAFDPLVTYLPVALFSKDLEIDRDGKVIKKDLNKLNSMDEEVAMSTEKGSGSAVALNTLTPPKQHDHGHLHPDTASMAVSKREYDDSIDASSQMPGVPTPNYSEFDAASLAQHSLHPSLNIPGGRDRPRSYARSEHHVDAMSLAAEAAEADEDPELRRLQEQAYCHPAVYSTQTPIWLPMDQRGIVADEIQRLSVLGITVATDGAGLDPKTGKTEVAGILFAPGEETRFRLERGA